MKRTLLYSAGMAANVAVVWLGVAIFNDIKSQNAETDVAKADPAIVYENTDYPPFVYDPNIQLPIVPSVRPDPRPDSIQTSCLALNLYHEARGEPVEGQIKVGFVTLNRIGKRGWGDSICGVVYKYKQFSWTLKKPRINFDNPENQAKYDEMYALADKIISGEVEDNSRGSTHYYSVSRMETKEAPYWADDYTIVAEIGRHTFLK